MKKIFKGFLMTLSTLAVGFIALALPFHLFDELSSKEMQLLFICEITVYLTIGMLYLAAKQRKRDRKIKEKNKALERRAKFQKAFDEYYSLAA